jgi:hypothetical protein
MAVGAGLAVRAGKFGLGGGGDGGDPDAAVTAYCGANEAGVVDFGPPGYPPPGIGPPGYGPKDFAPVTVPNTYPTNVCVGQIVTGNFWFSSVAVPTACNSWATLSCACLGANSFAPCKVGATFGCTTNAQGYPQGMCVGQ